MPDPKKNTAYAFSLSLVATAARPNFQASPTLATGDFKVSIDEGAFNNLATLPTVSPAAGRNVKVSLSAAEMNGDRIVVQAVDAAGAEWDEVMIAIQTSVNTTDEIKTETASIQTDTNDIQTRLPAALVSGRMDSSVGAMAAGTITAAAIADAAIDRAALAPDTGLQSARSGTAQAGSSTSITLDAGASALDLFYNGMVVYLTGGTGAQQANVIQDYDGTTKVATVIGFLVAPDATTTFALFPSTGGATVADIAAGVWDEAIAGHLTAGSTGAALNAAGGAGDPWITPLPGAYAAGQAGFILGTNLNATVSSRSTQTSVDAVQADTDNLQTRVPAALVGGRMDSSVGAMAANTVTGAALDPTAGAEIADAVWDEAIAGHLTAGSTGAALNAAGSSGDPWVTPIPGAYGAGTAGFIVGTNLNATVSSRASAAQATAIQADTDDIQARLPAALVGGRIDASVGAVAAGGITATSIATGAIDADALATDAVNEIVAGLLAGIVEGTTTVQGSLRLANSANGGMVAGLATPTVTIRDLANTKDRVTSSVDDDGNRTAVTLDLT